MRLKALVLAVVAAISAAVVATPVASAAPGNSVLIGDSMMANPSVAQYLTQRGIPLTSDPMSAVGCSTDFRFANAYRSVSRNEVNNYSCPGASYHTGGKHLIDIATKANRDGKLNRGTREVVLLAGANDTYPYVLNDKLPVPTIQRNLHHAMVRTIKHVKNLAPNARVKVVGYTRITNPQGRVCVVNLLPGHGFQSNLIQAKPLEDAIQNAGISASRATGATFVDTKGISRGKHMCAPDRWITGIIDGAPQHRNLALHLTHHGINEVGKLTARR